MGALSNYSEEKRTKIIESMKNNDVEAYKNLIGYDSMSQLEKIVNTVFYQDTIDTLNKISNTHSDKTTGSSNNNIKETLDFVNNVVNKTLNRY